MTTENRSNGGPAFPQHDLSGYGLGPATDGDRYLVDGMSLRDWFAGQVMDRCICNAMESDGSWDPANVAHHAYLMADAMLEARSLATRSSSKEA